MDRGLLSLGLFVPLAEVNTLSLPFLFLSILVHLIDFLKTGGQI